MFRLAIHGGQHTVTDHDRADITPWLLDKFLNIKNGMLHRAKRCLVFKHRFRRVAVIDLRQQPSPRTDDGLQHNRIAKCFNRFQRGFGCERHHIARLRHASLRQHADVVINLSPQISATAAVFTVGTPKAFNNRRAYNPLL